MTDTNSNFKFTRRKAFWFIAAPIGFIGIAMLLGWVVMSLWNAILPSVIVGVSVISFWQALGLLVLTRILFGGIGGGRRRGPWGRKGKSFGNAPANMRDRWMQMSDEEREQLKEEWRERCRKRDNN
jgi:hypothetical protein